MVGCRRGADTAANEDRQAKKMLQGIWSDDNGDAVLMAKGDSIFYPDSSSQPVKFWIYGDSLYLKGASINHYLITKQAPHLFKFINDMGDEVKLVKDDGNTLSEQFNVYRPYAMNIFRSLEADTMFTAGGSRYELRVKIDPTSDQVIKSDYNDVGLEVDNVYLDTQARVILLFDGVEIYSHEFQKGEFGRFLPKGLLDKSIIRDIELDHADASNVYLDATIGIPDATSSYVVEMRIQRDGKLGMKLK